MRKLVNPVQARFPARYAQAHLGQNYIQVLFLGKFVIFLEENNVFIEIKYYVIFRRKIDQVIEYGKADAT